MEMYEMRQSLNTSLKKLKDLGDSLDIANLKKRVEELDLMQQSADFWNDQKKARTVIQEFNMDKELISKYEQSLSELEDMDESLNELNKNYDQELFDLLNDEYEEVNSHFEEFEMSVLLSNDYDHANAILEIHPGAGGTESQDWASMLYRMYQRYAAKNGYSFEVVDYQDGDEAGIKSCSVVIKGDKAYGYLKGESGVHRLVRISPFDAGARRHTSFASVEVTPEFNDEIDITIDEKDLEIDTMRSSGAGGQHINKTDSAVRIRHIPTGIVVFSQSERSQIMNRERCMTVLKSKLYQKAIEEREAEKRALKGDQKKIEWGSQIRSYVFCPYTLVKDHRTGYEEGNINKVMDGDINEFLFAYLKSQI
ncbi:MAG: peptide chain release factor 2 [Erysipelotrichaceae bacterium]|nr:peptide chain release factor 2 [Solobacterium sp.]MDY5652583.1 peptide chain release factor 2 [Erysipelotrichaceae bacterium]